MKKILSHCLCSFFILTSCHTAHTIQKTENTSYVLSDSSNAAIDSTILRMIAPYKEKMESEMNVILAESEFAMEKGVPESRLGNFVADACMLEASGMYYPADGRMADFAFFNNGGLRRSLPKGKISRKDVFELMPFENELVVITMDGNLVKKIFNFIASKDGAPVAGAGFRIKDKEAVDITIHGEKLDSTRTYKALTSDYLANGGDSFEMLAGLPRENVGLKIRDALIQYLTRAGKEGKVISINTDGRISYAR